VGLENFVKESFGAQENALVEKPSFLHSEVTLREGSVALTMNPERKSASQIAGVPQAAPMEKAIQQLSSAQGFRAEILFPIEGYYVGGMARQDCTCGSAPAWISSDQKSQEPGRTNRLIFDELSLPKGTSIALQGGGTYKGFRIARQTGDSCQAVELLDMNGLGIIIPRSGTTSVGAGIPYRHVEVSWATSRATSEAIISSAGKTLDGCQASGFAQGTRYHAKDRYMGNPVSLTIIPVANSDLVYASIQAMFVPIKMREAKERMREFLAPYAGLR
jgi:hypothetical protein